MAFAVVGAACHATAADPSPTTAAATRPAPPTPTPAAATDPVAVARDAALHAYRGMWAAYDDAAATANPDDPALARFATGAALATLQRGLAGMRAKDQVGHGRVTVHPSVVALTPAAQPTQASISDCADTSAAMLYHRDGGPVNAVPGGWRHVDAIVTPTADGVWQVSTFTVQAVGSCDRP
jgi:hypothetical protein